MSEKVWKEYCEDCGCPLEICCKPKKPVVSLEALEKYCKANAQGRIDAFCKRCGYLPKLKTKQTKPFHVSIVEFSGNGKVNVDDLLSWANKTALEIIKAEKKAVEKQG